MNFIANVLLESIQNNPSNVIYFIPKPDWTGYFLKKTRKAFIFSSQPS